MDAIEPRARVVKRFCAPISFPCPHCGKRGRRKRTHTRPVRDIAYGEVLIVELTVGEYRARCSCCKTFRSQIEGIELRAQYTNRVREAVIDRLLDDSMSMERLREALQRDFHLNLSQGFLYDCLDWKVRQVDMPGYRQWTLENFSGTLNLDEIHLGHRTLLLATDPLSDFPVAFALVAANDQDHMRRFLLNLKNLGFVPKVVVTDGSTLYPKVLAELWPDARHQLCVFHVIKDINACVLDAVRRLGRRHAKTGGRQRRRGRRTKAQKRALARQGATKKEQAYYIWKRRHLLATRPDHLTARQRRQLSQMFEYLPELRRLRQFVLDIHRLFDPERSFRRAANQWAKLVNTPEYLADPDLARALAMLTPEKFEKMTAYLDSPLGKRVRTNNHVERTNRRLRYLEKVRYKWRRRRTIVRFVVLALDRWWRRQAAKATTKEQESHDAIASQYPVGRYKPAA
jgi:transposase-like protein